MPSQTRARESIWFTAQFDGLHCWLVRLLCTRTRGGTYICFVECTWYAFGTYHTHTNLYDIEIELRFALPTLFSSRPHTQPITSNVMIWRLTVTGVSNEDGGLGRRTLRGERTDARRLKYGGYRASEARGVPEPIGSLAWLMEQFAVAGLNFYGARNGHVVSSSVGISTFRWFERALVQARRGERPRPKRSTASVHW